MPKVLPQQQLLLELLRMSGEVRVMGDVEDTILWRTLSECHANGWIELVEIRPGLRRASITNIGRTIAGGRSR